MVCNIMLPESTEEFRPQMPSLRSVVMKIHCFTWTFGAPRVGDSWTQRYPKCKIKASVKIEILMYITKHMLLTKAVISDNSQSLLWKIPVALGFV